jgi:SAM-dependent methyltransferase
MLDKLPQHGTNQMSSSTSIGKRPRRTSFSFSGCCSYDYSMMIMMYLQKYIRLAVLGLLLLSVVWRQSMHSMTTTMMATTESSLFTMHHYHHHIDTAGMGGGTFSSSSSSTAGSTTSSTPPLLAEDEEEKDEDGSPLLQPPTLTSTTTIGALGPKGTNRQFLIYYDALYFLALQYTSYGHPTSSRSSSIPSSSSSTTTTTSTTTTKRASQSVLEVGCAQDPFIDQLTWIPNKFCVAPYQVDYAKDVSSATTTTNNNNSNKSSTSSLAETSTTTTTQMYIADFATWSPPPSTTTTVVPTTNSNNATTTTYDLVVCSQVIEHVDDPRSFVQKLLQMTNPESGGIAIISVPYQWRPCGTVCNHKWHYISEQTLLAWSHPYLPIETRIVTERNRLARLIAVYRPSDLNYYKASSPPPQQQQGNKQKKQKKKKQRNQQQSQ